MSNLALSWINIHSRLKETVDSSDHKHYHSRSTQNTRGVQQSIHQFYAKYRELILFNKSIIVSAIVSIIADAIVVQYAAESITNDILVSIFSMITAYILLHLQVYSILTIERSILTLIQVREIQIGLNKTQRK